MASSTDSELDKADRRQRSRSFPSMSLSKAVEWLGEIRSALGFKPFSKAMLAQAFKISSNSGSFFTKVAAMNAYGLLEGSGDQVRISDLGKRILAPQSEEERLSATQRAFAAPDLFEQLLRDFSGHPLPQQLANRLLHQYSITDTSKDAAAQMFVEGAKYAGLLDTNNYLSAPIHSTETVTERSELRSFAPTSEPRGGTIETAGPIVVSPSGRQIVTIELTEGRIAQLVLPMELNIDDTNLIQLQLDVFKLQAELRAKRIRTVGQSE